MILWSASRIGKRVLLLGVLAVSFWLLAGTQANGQAATAPAPNPASAEKPTGADAPAFDKTAASHLSKGLHVEWKGVVDDQGIVLLLKDGNTSYFARPTESSSKITLPKEGTPVVVSGVCDNIFKESDFTRDGETATVVIVLKDFTVR